MRDERRQLQAVLALVALVPICGGLAGVIAGPRLFATLGPSGQAFGPALDMVSLDSHFRYLSGLLLGIGILAACLVPKIDASGPALRVLAGIVFLGGLARLSGVVSLGWPNAAMVAGLGMELVVAPLLALWHWRWARRD